mgnify:CR=1 FL=1
MPEMMRMRRRASSTSVAAFLAILALAGGCGDGPCGNSEDRVVPLSELACNRLSGAGVWESHPLPPMVSEECEWLEFRGCSRYAFENPLGAVPASVVGYLSFDPDGRFSTVGSGNSFIVDEVSDDEVVIRNSQNQLFYLRLVLQ